MSLRSRLVLASSGLTIVSLGIGFALVFAAVTRAHELNLDRTLIVEAAKEAKEIATIGPGAVVLSDGPGLTVNGVGPLTKYAAIFASDGTLLERTSAWPFEPSSRVIEQGSSPCFDLQIGPELVRGTVAKVPGASGARLLLGAPRWDVDDDAALLRHAMFVAFVVAAAWSILVANFIVRRLTRGHSEIAGVIRRVAAGDLNARVAASGGDPELRQLSSDVNDMIQRLEVLLSSQQRFITHAAHELRSPLTTLYGELSYTLSKERPPEDYRRTVEEAFDAAKRLKHLVEDLLPLARAGARRSAEAELDLGALLEKSLAEIRWEADRRKIRFSVEGRGAVPGDESALVRMFRNVLENAVRYAPEASTVRVVCRSEGARMVVDVSDDGSGVPRADVEDVFAPFFRGRGPRSDDTHAGAGLGLAIAREIARAHGGELTLLSPGAGKGATFRFALLASIVTVRPADGPGGEDAFAREVVTMRTSRSH